MVAYNIRRNILCRSRRTVRRIFKQLSSFKNASQMLIIINNWTQRTSFRLRNDSIICEMMVLKILFNTKKTIIYKFNMVSNVNASMLWIYLVWKLEKLIYLLLLDASLYVFVIYTHFNRLEKTKIIKT